MRAHVSTAAVLTRVLLAQLLTALKEINQYIQRAGALRIGKAQSEIVRRARSASAGGLAR